MLDFICPTCGQFSLESETCTSCESVESHGSHDLVA